MKKIVLSFVSCALAFSVANASNSTIIELKENVNYNRILSGSGNSLKFNIELDGCYSLNENKELCSVKKITNIFSSSKSVVEFYGTVIKESNNISFYNGFFNYIGENGVVLNSKFLNGKEEREFLDINSNSKVRFYNSFYEKQEIGITSKTQESTSNSYINLLKVKPQ